MNRRDRAIAKAVCDRNMWLASIVLSPHLFGHPRLSSAAAAHLLHAAGFQPPKNACTQGDQPPPSKRRKLHHNQQDTARHPKLVEPLQQLWRAAASGDDAKIEQICKQYNDVDINAGCGPQGRTALHAAAESGSVGSCRVLLDRGADTYCSDDSNTSPLMLAAAQGHTDVVKVLLEAGADPFHVDASGTNPLMCAARCGSAPVIALLLSEGVDADYANSDLGGGEHALLLAAECGAVVAVRQLLAAGARVNRTDKAGRSALWMAARNGHALVVQLLLSQPGVKHIRSFDARSTTPLQEAQAGHHRAVAALLSDHLQQQQLVLQGQQQQHDTQLAQHQGAGQQQTLRVRKPRSVTKQLQHSDRKRQGAQVGLSTDKSRVTPQLHFPSVSPHHSVALQAATVH